MIVPHPRLLWWTGLAGVPAAALLGAAGEPAGALLLVLLVAAAAGDALAASGRLHGILLEAPAVVRLTGGRSHPLALRVRDPGGQGRRLRIGLAAPPGLALDEPVAEALLPAGGAAHEVGFRVTPARRGRYPLGPCVVEERSGLGLWEVRRQVPLATEVRVYPGLLGERRRLAALFLRRGGPGVQPVRTVGKGREFEKLREYVPGDAPEDIHWKATARRGHPITKVFQVERTQEVYVLVDASRLSARPGADPDPGGGGAPDAPGAPAGPGVHAAADPESATLLDRFVSAALVLGMAAERQGDRYGLVLFADRVERFLPAGAGRAHFTACREALVDAAPRLVSPDFEELFVFLRQRVRRRALLVLVTCLDDPVLAESLERAVSLVSRQHLVLAALLRPPLAAPLFEEEAGTTDEVVRRLAGHLIWHDARELEARLGSRGVQTAALERPTLAADVVSRYLAIKGRQLL